MYRCVSFVFYSLEMCCCSCFFFGYGKCKITQQILIENESNKFLATNYEFNLALSTIKLESVAESLSPHQRLISVLSNTHTYTQMPWLLGGGDSDCGAACA